MKFTNAELEQRLQEHNRNSQSGLKLAGWSSDKTKIEAQNLHYKSTQMKLASAFSELLAYRKADPNFKEESET